MSDLIVHGGAPLSGTIHPSANKNAVLPILAATLLTHEPVRLERVPEITDARRMLELFRAMGSRVEADFTTGVVEIQHRDTAFDPRTMRLPEGMRSSILLVPPLLTRFGCARIEDEVRGCTLGVREIDPHIEVFEHFGARTERGEDGWVLNVKRPLQAVHHWLDYASVTTTENFVLCAVLAQGRSVLTNAACEPHVQEFCRFLISLGARIDGVGTSTLSVTGVPGLRGGTHRFDEDFHEITTFLALSAITGGDVRVKNPVPEQFPLIDRTFAKLGAFVSHQDGWSRVVTEGGALRVREPFTRNVLPKIEAAPWPYLSVDLLPIFIALGVRASGSVLFWNKVYDGALGWTSELAKFGAQAFQSDPHRVVTFGGKPLSPAEVESPYIIRVAIALLMVAASIEGRSVIRHAGPIRRAHPQFVENLVALGARIEWREP
jgi:UDP-N-acetylglucosamine 1-carboxyvinyltransferase